MIKVVNFNMNVTLTHNPTRTLLERGEEAIKVLVAVGDEEDVQRVPRALDQPGSGVPTEPTDDLRVDAVAVSDLHVVKATRVVKL